MSVALTEQAVVERRKRVTRRLGWWKDKRDRRLLSPGDRITLCRKVMGRKPGEPLVRLAEVEVMSVRRELLWTITAEDVAAECVPVLDRRLADRFDDFDYAGLPTPQAWVRWFCAEMGCTPDTEVTRIEWRYLDGDA